MASGASLVVAVSLATMFPALHGYAGTGSAIGSAAAELLRLLGWSMAEPIRAWHAPFLWLIGPPHAAIHGVLQGTLGGGVAALLADGALLALALLILVSNTRHLRATAGFRAPVVDAAAPRTRFGYWVAAAPGLLLIAAFSSVTVLAAFVAYLGVLGLLVLLRVRSTSAPPAERRADADGAL